MVVHHGSYSFGLDRLNAIRPARGQIQARYFRGVSTFLRARGINPRTMLEAQGVDPLSFSDPDNHLDCMAMASMMERCASLCDDPLFGFNLAERQDSDVFGMVSALACAAPTFRKAIQCLIEYLPVLHSPEGPLWLAEASDAVEIRWTACGHLREVEQTNYQGSFLMMKMFRMLGGEDFKVRYLGLACDMSPATIGRLQDRLGCTVFRHEENIAGISADMLHRPVPTANALLFELLGGYLASAKEHAAPQLRDQVQGYIRSTLPTGLCSIDRCAARLGVSARSLQKRLGADGLSFWSIVEHERLEVAKRELCSGEDSLDEIALSLGYSDQTCFGRAFKRWTGTTPQAFRAKRGC